MLVNVPRKYANLPTVCDIPGCMEQQVKYIGSDAHGLVPGEIYTASWRAETYVNQIIGFRVNIHHITGKTKTGREQGFIQVKCYESPEEILKNWEFPDLLEWQKKKMEEEQNE